MDCLLYCTLSIVLYCVHILVLPCGKIINKQAHQLSGLAYIPICWSPSPPAVASLSHGPRSCPASLSHLANDRPMHYWFFTFWLWGVNLWAKVHHKGRSPASHIGLQSYQISSPCVNPRRRCLLQKILRTHRQTVNAISPACLSACGDNNNNCYWILC